MWTSKDRRDRESWLASPLGRDDDLVEIKNDLLEDYYIAWGRAPGHDTEGHSRDVGKIFPSARTQIDEKTFPADASTSLSSERQSSLPYPCPRPFRR